MGRRADAMLVAPASATTIAKLAQGVGDNPVTLTALATSAPLVVAPAMDSVMYGAAVGAGQPGAAQGARRVYRRAGQRTPRLGRNGAGAAD